MADEEEAVGDSSRNVLRNIQAAARELMRIAVHCSINAARVEEQESSLQLPTTLALKKEKERLLQKRVESAVELELRAWYLEATNELKYSSLQISNNCGPKPLDSVSVTDDQESPEVLRQRLMTLGEELVSAKSHYHQNMLLLECLQKSGCLCSRLFEQTTHSANDKLLISLVEKQTGVVSEVLRNTQELQQLYSDISSVRRQRADSKLTCRTLMAQMETLQQQQQQHSHAVSTEHDQRVAEDLKRCHSEAALLRHTLQCLIAGSGVDWAEDETLLQLTLSLGTHPQT